jgi:predicted ABC-type ATPase
VADRGRITGIHVLAGTNGAGKSSVAGAALLRSGAEYFNPDEATRQILCVNPGMSQEEANSEAWYLGTRLLERAIAERSTFAFETTLGGRTITALLQSAMQAGIEVRIRYVGLSSPELHIARVRARVATGGHDIPETRIRERFDSSRLNLIDLMPALNELWVYDNSEEADPATGVAPVPLLVLHMKAGKVVDSCDLAMTPHWAKPIIAAAFRTQYSE